MDVSRSEHWKRAQKNANTLRGVNLIRLCQDQVKRELGTQREGVLHVLSAAAFLIFFQCYLVAPLIPALSKEFHSSTDYLGLLVPAYMLPY